jgi:hypothetical protein
MATKYTKRLYVHTYIQYTKYIVAEPWKMTCAKSLYIFGKELILKFAIDRIL